MEKEKIEWLITNILNWWTVCRLQKENEQTSKVTKVLSAPPKSWDPDRIWGPGNIIRRRDFGIYRDLLSIKRRMIDETCRGGIYKINTKFEQ